MSYDLMVFEADAAPRDRKEFMKWYEALTEWGEGHDYNDPQFCTSRLYAWYRDMILEFPAMNGPDGVSDDEIDNPKVTDYCIARQAIYVAFAWSQVDPAYAETKKLAIKHRLGFFDVSANEGQILFPTEDTKPKLSSNWWGRLFGGSR